MVTTTNVEGGALSTIDLFSDEGTITVNISVTSGAAPKVRFPVLEAVIEQLPAEYKSTRPILDTVHIEFGETDENVTVPPLEVAVRLNVPADNDLSPIGANVIELEAAVTVIVRVCLLYTSPSPRD